MSKKIRVLRILNRFNLGGPVYNASYLTKYLEEEFECRLIGGKKLDEEEDALFIPESLGIRAEVIPEMTRSVGLISDFKAYQKIRKIIREFRPDIVHTHASKAGALGRMAAKKEKVPVVIHTFHGHVFEHYFSPWKSHLVKATERFLARKSAAIIAISQRQKNDLVRRFRIAPEEKVHLIPLGFELEKFRENKENKRRSFRSGYNFSEDQLVVGIVGRLAAIKNHELFIRTMARIVQKRPKVRSVIIGDGEIRKKLEELALSLGLKIHGEDANMIFTSWIKNVSEVLPGMDVLALTSLNEGTPVSLIEAQAAGIPVLSSDVGGVKDVVKNHEASFFESKNELDFETKLMNLIDNEALRRELAREGEIFAFENFTAQRLAIDAKKLYLELLNQA